MAGERVGLAPGRLLVFRASLAERGGEAVLSGRVNTAFALD